MNGIIFDVDGTLWDSTEEVAISWNRAIKDFTDLKTTLTGAQLMKEFGKPMDEIMLDLFPELSLAERDTLARRLYDYENEDMLTAPCKVYDGMPETIQALAKRYPLFIVSNCADGYIEAFLQNTGLGEYITDFTCPAYTNQLKGANIRIIMERNHLDKAIYVGDTQGDADACAEAEVPMIYARYGFGEAGNFHVAVDCFTDLLSINYEEIFGKVN